MTHLLSQIDTSVTWNYKFHKRRKIIDSVLCFPSSAGPIITIEADFVQRRLLPTLRAAPHLFLLLARGTLIITCTAGIARDLRSPMKVIWDIQWHDIHTEHLQIQVRNPHVRTYISNGQIEEKCKLREIEGTMLGSYRTCLLCGGNSLAC